MSLGIWILEVGILSLEAGILSLEAKFRDLDLRSRDPKLRSPAGVGGFSVPPEKMSHRTLLPRFFCPPLG